jgi:hypothetical protein
MLPTLTPYIAILAILVAGFGAWTVHRYQLQFWQGLTIFLSSVSLLVVAYLVHWRINSRAMAKRQTKEDTQLAKVNEELAWREKQHEREREIARQETLEAEIREEKRRLGERIACECPSCTMGQLETRTKHIAAKRDMWDLDGKAVSREGFQGAKEREPIPGEDKRAFPPQSFAKEQAVVDAKDKRDRAKRKYELLLGLGMTEEGQRAKMQNPALQEHERIEASRALEAFLLAKADSGEDS